MHTVIPNTYEEGIDELEKDIEHLERRLASAKSQLMFVTYQKDKQFKS
jgi:chaperonin cofactor prefoldin